MTLIFQEKKGHLEGMPKLIKQKLLTINDLNDSLSVSKNSIKDLFDELLQQEGGFKYIISVKITLKKRINDKEFDPRTHYFNSLIKTVINRRYHLNESFEEILNLLDIWINDGSG